jgi:hypothetical protein
MTRTEGMVVGVITFGIGWLLGKERRKWFVYGVGFVLGIAAYQWFRFAYFGALVTGPQLVKLSQQHILGGLVSIEFFIDLSTYLQDYLLGSLSVGLFIGVGLLQNKRFLKLDNGTRLFVLAGLLLGGLWFVYARTNMIQNFASRFFYHTTVFQVLLVGIGLACIRNIFSEFFSQPTHSLNRVMTATALIAGLFVVTVQWGLHYPSLVAEFENFTSEYRSQQSSGSVLAVSLNHFDNLDDEWLITVVDSGIIPYYTNAKTLGGDGLTNVALAPLTRDLPEGGAAYSQFLLDYQPGVFVIERYNNKLSDEHKALLCNPQFEQYSRAARFERGNDNAYVVYLRDDIPNFAEIQAHLLAVEPRSKWFVKAPKPLDEQVTRYVAEACPQ